MAKTGVTFDTVKKIALAMPGVEESTAYGSPALKVNGKMLAGIPTQRPDVEPGTLGVHVDLEDRAELLAAAPDIYYVTKHYANYPAVLVRMSRMSPDVLRDLLGMSYKFVTRKAAPRSPARKRR